MAVNGLRRATVSIQPESNFSGHEDRRQKQYEEDRRAYHGAGLLGAEQHRHPRPEKGRGYVGEQREADEAEQVEAAAYRHPRDQRDRGDENPRHGGAHDRGDGVAEDDPIPVRGGQHEPPGETVLEVTRDRKPRESPPMETACNRAHTYWNAM